MLCELRARENKTERERPQIRHETIELNAADATATGRR